MEVVCDEVVGAAAVVAENCGSVKLDCMHALEERMSEWRGHDEDEGPPWSGECDWLMSGSRSADLDLNSNRMHEAED